MPRATKNSVAFWATTLCVVLQVAVVSALVDTYTASLFAGDGTIGDSVYNEPAVDSPLTSFGIRTNPATGELFFIDGDCAISKIDASGNLVLVSGGSVCSAVSVAKRDVQKRGTVSAQSYTLIFSIAFDSAGNLYVAESAETAGPLWKLDLVGGTSTQIGTIDDVYQIAVSPAGTKLYYSLLHSQEVYERDLVTSTTDRRVYTGNFDTFVVSPDGLSLWGSKFTYSTVSQVDIVSGTATIKVGSVTTTFTGTPNAVTPGTAGVLPSFSGLAFDRRGNLVIASANHVFYYEVASDTYSLIAGSGASTFSSADYPITGAALSAPLFIFDVAVSPNSDVFYVDFQENASGYAFFEKFALDLSDVSIAVAPASIAEDAASVATFTVTRSVAHSFPITVKLALSGTAAFDVDYSTVLPFTMGLQTVTIPAGATTATFTVDPTPDASYLESSETVIVTVTASAGVYNVGSPAAATLTITNVAQANGDPHMIGFQGQVYDFIGEANKIYNVLSDPALQVNMQLYLQRSGEHTYIPGPVMQKLGFATMHHQIVIDCGGSLKGEDGTVTIDGRQLAQDGSIVLPDDKVTIVRRTLSTTAKAVGLGGNDHVVGSAHFVMEGLFEFTVYFIENVGNPHRPDAVSDSKWHRRFLDFNSVLLDEERRPHGVLGQTAAPVSRERSLENWTIEGSDSDYVIKDGLLGKKFTFNQFQ